MFNDTNTTEKEDFLSWIKKQRLKAEIEAQQYEETEREVKQRALLNSDFYANYIQQQEQRQKKQKEYEQQNKALGLLPNCNRELTALCLDSKLKDLTYYKLLPFIPVNTDIFKIAKYQNERVDVGNIIRKKRSDTLQINNPILRQDDIELNEYCLAGCYDYREYDIYGDRLPINLAFNLRKHVLIALELETALKLQDTEQIPDDNKMTLSDEKRFSNPDVNPLKLLQEIAEKMEDKTDFNSNVNLVMSQNVWNAIKENPNIQERFDGIGGLSPEALKNYLNLSGEVLVSKLKYKGSYIWQKNLFFCISPDYSVNMPENNGIGNIFIHEKYPQVTEYDSNGGNLTNIEYTTLCNIAVRDREKGFLIENCID